MSMVMMEFKQGQVQMMLGDRIRARNLPFGLWAAC